jgi:hypothetical protein
MYGPNFTFLGIPACDLDDPTSYAGADVIIVGAPIDSGTSHRSGAKFGPQAIRGGDYLPHDGSRPHLALRTDGLKDLKVLDAGDLLMPGGDLVSSLAVLRAATEKISRAGIIPVILLDILSLNPVLIPLFPYLEIMKQNSTRILSSSMKELGLLENCWQVIMAQEKSLIREA